MHILDTTTCTAGYALPSCKRLINFEGNWSSQWEDLCASEKNRYLMRLRLLQGINLCKRSFREEITEEFFYYQYRVYAIKPLFS